MPLNTSQKIAHVLAAVNKSYAGRQKTVVVAYQNTGGGSYSYAAIQMIFRPDMVIDPEIPDSSGRPAGRPADLQAVAPLGTNFTGAVFIADTATATQAAVALATKYQIIEVLPVGIVAGGSHLRITLRRFR